MIGVCLKWVERRPEVDPLTGEVRTDPRTSGASDADLAALEHGLRLSERWSEPVLAVTAGPEGADAVLREALAAGAARAVRVDLPVDAPSEVVAAELAAVLRAEGADAVVCGAWSLDRGSGSVPAFVAAHLDAAQALGLVTLATDGRDVRDSSESSDSSDGSDVRGVRAERRLDGGRRERLRVSAPMVLSVEGSLALRRAPLDALLAAKSAAIEVVTPRHRAHAATPAEVGPYRPRPRVLPPPSPELGARERILALTGALVERTPPERVVLDPPEAADRILAQLRTWGYLE